MSEMFGVSGIAHHRAGGTDIWRHLIKVAFVWATAQVVLLAVHTVGDPRAHAVALMAGGLFLLWCVGGGGLMWLVHPVKVHFETPL